MSSITATIHSDDAVTVSPLNPFLDDNVVLPLRGNVKGLNFFKHVQALMAERDPATVAR